MVMAHLQDASLRYTSARLPIRIDATLLEIRERGAFKLKNEVLVIH
jgi:hypothetical protein